MTRKELSDSLSKPRGLSPQWKRMRTRALHLLEMFDDELPGSPGREVVLGFVPGRIEVFGRHTDYAGGRSLVCAIDRGFLFAAAKGRGRRMRLREDSREFVPVEFDLDPRLVAPPGQWANYPMTMARRFARNFGAVSSGVDIALSSTMPVGSGMSGSSALMMMVFTALAVVNGLPAHPVFRRNILDPVDLAVYLACAENGQGFRGLEGDVGVGTFGGSEDHAGILNGRQGTLSLFGFSPPALQAEIRWPRGWRMVVAFSGVRAEKTREALERYNMASRRARESVEIYNRLFDARCATLREVVDHPSRPPGTAWLELLDRNAGAGAPGLAERVRQFILEDRTHVPGAVEALRSRDMDAFGRLLSASHRASKKGLWNIVPEIDFLQKAACRLGAAGASGFGAGFGGSILAVIPSPRAREFTRAWRERYVTRYPSRTQEAAFFVADPAPGIQVWEKAGPRRFADLVFQT